MSNTNNKLLNIDNKKELLNTSDNNTPVWKE